jgi:hypothetical protein
MLHFHFHFQPIEFSHIEQGEKEVEKEERQIGLTIGGEQASVAASHGITQGIKARVRY